ncbi:MAG: hypothetical protein ACKVWV_11115 [Planctomycetota bacterium]
MSSIGRILIIVNLVLAAAFVGWAANATSAYTGYKTKYDAEVAARTGEKAQLTKDLSTARADAQAAQEKMNQSIAARDDAQNEAKRLKDDLDKETTRNRELNGNLEKIANTLTEIESSKSKLQADKDRALQAQMEAEKLATTAAAAQMKAEEAQSEAESKLRSVESQIADLEIAKTRLDKEVSSLTTRLETLRDATGGTVAAAMPAMPLIEARVLNVDTSVKPGLVAVNVGEAAGVQRGFTFEVYEGKTYKGQIRIEYVHPNMASGVITRLVSGQSIRQGDGAATRL